MTGIEQAIWVGATRTSSMNNPNPSNLIGSPLAQTFAPNTIDGNGLNLRSHD
ncbi:MAG: hypothetical protein RLP02_04385 [Coleofasciculus sp. C2-GNP5-27]